MYWRWCKKHKEVCKVIDTQILWGDTRHTVWLPRTGAVLKVMDNELVPLEESALLGDAAYLTYVASAAKVTDSLGKNALLSPLEASIIPLPHQIKVLSTALSKGSVRYLLADEVGLGKTIEAGLIIRELKLRGLAKRILIIVPRGLVAQWISEMELKFNERFKLILPEDVERVKRLFPDHHLSAEKEDGFRLPHLQRVSETGFAISPSNPFVLFNQVICTLDSFKPLGRRKGWTREEVDNYNQKRYQSLIDAGWDLIIVDEAHRIGGSTEQVARHRLGRGLAQAAPHLLLLTATPHQGKSHAFLRLMSLLDEKAFVSEDSVSREKVKPYVIRTEKRKAIDFDGKPLFKPRHTRLQAVNWQADHALQKRLYESVSDYVREGYNQALKEKRNYIGFLLLLMQRLVASSTRAIREALEKRLAVLETAYDEIYLSRGLHLDDEWAELDAEKQLESLLGGEIGVLTNEAAEVRRLLDLARETEAVTEDAKARALLQIVYELQQKERDADLKFLVFTEFVATQTMLKQYLLDRGFSVVCLNGSMDLEQRVRAQREFAGPARFLVSTDAGGEGLNLQFCHSVINYDIPWNPMKLEQRIGRVDRIGQENTVMAVNLVLADTVEHRVQEVIEEKLSVILKEFGVDKTEDVLDSARAGRIFDDAYRKIILRPDSAPEYIHSMLNQVKDEVQASKYGISIFETTGVLDPKETKGVYENPIQDWIERMVRGYLQTYGGKVERKLDSWDLTWPDGSVTADVVFSARDAQNNPTAVHLTMEDPRIRSVAQSFPPFVPGQPMYKVLLPNLPDGLKGYWSLWKVGLKSLEFEEHRILPYFITAEGRILASTAGYVWDRLVAGDPNFPVQIRQGVTGDEAINAFNWVQRFVVKEAKGIYDELAGLHKQRLYHEREKSKGGFKIRENAIERLGLESVRIHRRKTLERDMKTWQREMKEKEKSTPSLSPIIVVMVK